MASDGNGSEPKSPRLRFTLWHMLVAITVVCVLIGTIPWLGRKSFLVFAAVGVLATPFVWHPRWLYVWMLPLLWTPIAWGNFYHCGDEYAGFVIGSIAGIWGAFLSSSSSPLDWLLPVLAAGAVTTLIAGAIMDRLRVIWPAWLITALVIAIALYLRWFYSFPSVERALARNGSYETYVLTTSNFGLTAATVVMIVVFGIWRLATWLMSMRKQP